MLKREAKTKSKKRTVKKTEIKKERTEYDRVEDARLALSGAGFVLVHTPPGVPMLWRRGDEAVACARPKRGGAWRHVPFPMEILKRADELIRKKLAALKKLMEKEAAARPAKKRGGAAVKVDVTETSVLKATELVPKRPARQKIQKLCDGKRTVKEIMKKAGCDLAEIAVLLGKKFVVVTN